MNKIREFLVLQGLKREPELKEVRDIFVSSSILLRHDTNKDARIIFLTSGDSIIFPHPWPIFARSYFEWSDEDDFLNKLGSYFELDLFSVPEEGLLDMIKKLKEEIPKIRISAENSTVNSGGITLGPIIIRKRDRTYEL